MPVIAPLVENEPLPSFAVTETAVADDKSTLAPTSVVVIFAPIEPSTFNVPLTLRVDGILTTLVKYPAVSASVYDFIAVTRLIAEDLSVPLESE